MSSKEQGGNNNQRRKHAYKVVLGSAGHWTEVLRRKAQALRGTSLSIDAMPTLEQLSSRQRMMPVALQAKTAGQSVRWRYGALFIDAKQYAGRGSLPSPDEHRISSSSPWRVSGSSVRC